MSGLSYEEARHLIQDGDIVFFHGSWRNPFQALVMAFTRSKFSHVCIAFRMKVGDTERVMCVEAQGRTRRRILSLSFYGNKNMVVVSSPKPWTDIQTAALERVGVAKYSMLSAIYVGIREYLLKTFSIRLPISDLPHEICSEFVADVLGMEDTEISPQLLYEELMKVTNERQ